MKGMVFLLYGLPPFLARAGPKGLGGRGGKDLVGTSSIGHRRQVWELPSCPQGYRHPLCASTTQVEKRMSSSYTFRILKELRAKGQAEWKGRALIPSQLWP